MRNFRLHRRRKKEEKNGRRKWRQSKSVGSSLLCNFKNLFVLHHLHNLLQSRRLRLHLCRRTRTRRRRRHHRRRRRPLLHHRVTVRPVPRHAGLVDCLRRPRSLRLVVRRRVLQAPLASRSLRLRRRRLRLRLLVRDRPVAAEVPGGVLLRRLDGPLALAVRRRLLLRLLGHAPHVRRRRRRRRRPRARRRRHPLRADGEARAVDGDGGRRRALAGRATAVVAAADDGLERRRVADVLVAGVLAAAGQVRGALLDEGAGVVARAGGHVAALAQHAPGGDVRVRVGLLPRALHEEAVQHYQEHRKPGEDQHER
eukprot:Rhum_TRINITY_DN14247_c26_g1::Rhum_TRINITY_DN14247_c26_g1_i1::g.77334::m.77334